MKTSARVVVSGVNMLKTSWTVLLVLVNVLVLVLDSANGVNLAPVFDQNMNQHRIKENMKCTYLSYTKLDTGGFYSAKGQK